jgi:hypothetical protein
MRRIFLYICELGGLLNYSPGAWKTTNKNYGNYFQPLDFLQSHKGASREESLDSDAWHARVRAMRPVLDPDGA